jgi:leader peptidase (prepilin peptidase)/N-methyltransferase
MQFFSQLNYHYQIFLIAILSVAIGSNISFLSYRIANNKSIFCKRSICVICNKALSIKNLIPIFSWIFQKGKCSYCNSKISIRYPLIELSFLIGFLLTFFVCESKLDLKTIIYLAIFTNLMFMIITDLEHYFIPNSSQYFLFFLSVILLFIDSKSGQFFNHLQSAFLYAGFGVGLWLFFYYGAGIEAIGIDDIKFFFVSGFMLGIKLFLTFNLISGLIGVIFGLAWQKLKKDDTFPFAPAICCSAYLCLLFGKKINVVDLFGKMIL